MPVFSLFLLLVLIAALPVHAVEPADAKRLNEVAERGAHVMSFNLEKTTHIFSKTDKGGIQQVIAKDKSDTEQIRLIREHLSEISAEFSQGNFSKPMQIHGDEMPGLAELRMAKPDQIQIEYRELPDGAQIGYTTEVPKLTLAIHRWFDAQLSDHARHAVPGHSHQHEHPHRQ